MVPEDPGRRESGRATSTCSSPAARAVKGADVIYNLACRHGRHGLHREQQGLCMLSVLINTHLLHGRPEARRRALLLRLLGLRLQRRQAEATPNVTALKEEDAYPALPEDGYGWEKLFSERMCRHFREDFGIADPRRPLPQRLRPATAPGTAAARRPRPPSAARSSTPS